MATAACHTIPYAWVEGTHDGGRIVTPYTGEAVLGALLVLDVHDGIAEGHAAGEAAFMPLRGQRLNQSGLPTIDEIDDLHVRVDITGTQVDVVRATPT